MDKSTLSNYGWIVIAVLVLAVMIALATPFGTYIKSGVESTTQGLFDTSEKAMNVVGMSAGEGSFDGDTGSSTPTKDPALNPSGTIPENATYKQGSTTYNAGDSFPETVANNDTYTYGNYVYTYKTSSNGWAVSIYEDEPDDRYQTSYGAILESINEQLVTDMNETFYGCYNLITAPKIPSSVTNMYFTFAGCSALTTAPDMSEATSVTNMAFTFEDCHSLETVSVIPSSVTDMTCTFQNCISLTTVPEIPSSVTSMYGTFNYCGNIHNNIHIPCTLASENYFYKGVYSRVTYYHIVGCNGSCGA